MRLDQTLVDAPERLSAPLLDLLKAAGVAEPTWEDIRAITRTSDVHPEISAGAEARLADPEAYATFTNAKYAHKGSNAADRLAFYVVSRLVGHDSQKARERLLEEIDQSATPFDALEIDRSKGCLLARPQGWTLYDNAIAEARRAFEAAVDSESAAEINPGKTFMATVPLPNVMGSQLMALATHPSTLKLVGRYLDGVPLLMRINLLRSSNTFIQDGSSQFFHIDPEDFRQMKLFLMVTDVDDDSGPLHLLEAAASDLVRVKRDHRYGRLDDDEVIAITGPEPLMKCVGPSGTVAFGDTSRCFHFGSRKGDRERWVVMIQYVTPFGIEFPIGEGELTGKYTQAARARVAQGVETSEREQHLFGVKR